MFGAYGLFMSGWSSEVIKFRAILMAIGFLLVCTVMSCQELKYAVRGKTVAANLGQVKAIKRSETEIESKSVEYNFIDNGTYRREYADVPVDWEPQPGQDKILVEYIPGIEGRSRLKGQTHMGYVWMLAASVLFLGFVIWKISRPAEPWRKPARR